ncbi:MAG: DUF4167 domain-containing protein [Cereibacter sphaeroides]|uniref:DUF4167 domain-containing protein n=1 Tax=Cereibacter sphaeroides TaxID=1063 RepID=A0A2W5SJX9_CERSP|nr:MAG: DUF4167 domain-containing protein [Cereibacter sphaeroides]
MRSSKSRSRSKSNRPRSIGNIVNRVFDSSGPEGKVRGTPQQIIEKYQFLARDAQLSNDRVAAENFMQHAEHYTRMLAEAQRELAAEQEMRRPQGEYGQGGSQGGNQSGNGQNAHSNGNGNGNGNYQQGGNRDRYRDDQRQDNRQEPRNEQRSEPRPDPRDEQPDLATVRSAPMMDFIDEISDSGLVETPETRRNEPEPRTDFNERRERGPKLEQQRNERQDRRNDRRNEDRKPRAEIPPVAEQPAIEAPVAAQPMAPVSEAPAVEAAAPAPKKPRAPRKPKVDPERGGSGPAEAAE